MKFTDYFQAAAFASLIRPLLGATLVINVHPTDGSNYQLSVSDA